MGGTILGIAKDILEITYYIAFMSSFHKILLLFSDMLNQQYVVCIEFYICRFIIFVHTLTNK